MIKDCYVVDTENTRYWFETRNLAEDWIKHCREKDGQKDIRFTYSKCKINDDDKDSFEELEVIEVFLP